MDKLVREVEALLRTSLAPDVALRIDVAPATFAHADPAQLRRVLTNLALNASDAVGAQGAIEIAVRTAEQAGAKSLVEFVVRDTGAGMEPSTLARIFDPFFTTKAAGQGTGLGLAIVARIVESHGASIEVASERGRGTRFRLLWPAAIATPLEAGVAAIPITGGNECVLLAEDEPAVRRLARAALERRGYRVIEACDGEEAVALFDKNRDAIDLLVVDLAMPRRNGLDGIAALRADYDPIAAVLMSGQGGLAGEIEVPHRVIALDKPFRPDDLASAVRRALDSAAKPD